MKVVKSVLRGECIKYNFLVNKLRGLVGAGLLLALAGPAARAQQTAFACGGDTYLIQGAPTKGYTVDLTAGTVTAQGTSNGNGGNIYQSATLNALGYNSLDGYLWSQNNGAGSTQANGQTVTQLVRIGTEFTGQAVDLVLPSGYTQTTFTVGDVALDGRMYLTRGGSAEGSRSVTDIYTVDLKQTARPMVASVIQSPVGSYLTDWAVSIKDTSIYALYSTINNTIPSKLTLYRFLLRARKVNGVVEPIGTRQTLGTVAGGSTPIVAANFASSFMDKDGSFYVMASSTGYIHRIDRPDLLPEAPEATSIPVSFVGTGQIPTANNTDGARCVRSRPSTGALPVQLVAFTATAAPPRAVRLAWTTASELHNDYFEVQRSADGRTYTPLGRVAGHGSTTQASTYAYLDETPGAAGTYYYRLRQADTDGSSTYGPAQAVTLTVGSSPTRLAAAPNPTTAADLRLQVQYAGPAPTPATLTVRDLLGRPVLTQPVTLQPGDNALTPAAPLAPGVYWVGLAGAGTPPGVRVLVTE